MNSAGAKTYATPEMMVQFKAMLGLDAGFSRDEAAYLDVYTIDELLTLEFRVWKYEADMVTRDGGPERGMPYLTRDSFLTFLAYKAILHPVGSFANVLSITEQLCVQSPSNRPIGNSATTAQRPD